jgi:hypothetical protein
MVYSSSVNRNGINTSNTISWNKLHLSPIRHDIIRNHARVLLKTRNSNIYINIFSKSCHIENVIREQDNANSASYPNINISVIITNMAFSSETNQNLRCNRN